MKYRVLWSHRQKYRMMTAGLAIVGSLAWCAAQAAPIALGFISWDVTIPGSFGQFDITNMTGPNECPPGFPVDTEVQFTSLSLVVQFSDGSTTTFGPSYFTLNPDGESLDGSPVAIGGVSPQPTEASLSGDLTPTTIDVSGTPTMVDASFDTATILPSSPPNLADGDFAVINAEPAAVSATPEPDMILTLILGSSMVLILARRPRRRDGLKSRLSAAGFRGAAGAVFASAAILSPVVSFAATTLHQNTASTPGSGVAGISFLNITASGFPSGPINPANVTIKLAPTCPVGATGPVAGEADATATSVKPILGSTDRVSFEVPSTLLSGEPIATGTYMAQIVDTTAGFAGGNCSIVMVTASTTSLNACLPTSSLGVVTGTTVTAYVPNGWWGGSATGLTAVQIEGGAATTSITTPNVVNSCAGNPATGQVVCTGNNTDVYLISGSPPALTNTLTSGLTGIASFSGGSCNNCGVAINALTNTAAINGGSSTSPSGDGIQVLNLNTNSFQPVFNTVQPVSEDISIDPGRNLILSPNENNNYVLYSLNSATGAITGELDNTISTGGEPDSAAEDCSTGIGLSSLEFTNTIYLANLAQATFSPGSPGSWTAPSLLFLPTGSGSNFSAGISGISVAQGSSHLAIYTGEFGGAGFGILELPATQTSGNPSVVDYVTGLLPPTPDGFVFQSGCDPHTVTAYTSPNNGLAYGVMASWVPLCFVGGKPTWLAVIDLAKTIDPVATPRQFGTTHTIDPSVDLIANGNVRYVKVQ